MTDITELVQRLKAAAEKATPGSWRYIKTNPFMDAEISAANNTRIVNLLGGGVTEANSKFIALANPANIISLVEALEKAQARIAELEARTVKLPKSLSVLHRRDFIDAHRAIYAYSEAEVNAALDNVGIKWESE